MAPSSLEGIQTIVQAGILHSKVTPLSHTAAQRQQSMMGTPATYTYV